MNGTSPMKQICASLVKAQKGFAPALKTSSNPHFKSRYAALDAVVEAVIDSLNANGIFLSQETEDSDHGVRVQTTLIHETGECLSFGWLTVPVSKNDAQGYGSALTYARRYSLMTALGVAPEDDDGNAAVEAQKRAKEAAEAKAKADAEFAEKFALEEKVEEALVCYREAALNGMAALTDHHKSVAPSKVKTALWTTHCLTLKAAAEAADKEKANA